MLIICHTCTVNAKVLYFVATVLCIYIWNCPKKKSYYSLHLWTWGLDKFDERNASFLAHTHTQPLVHAEIWSCGLQVGSRCSSPPGHLQRWWVKKCDCFSVSPLARRFWRLTKKFRRQDPIPGISILILMSGNWNVPKILHLFYTWLRYLYPSAVLKEEDSSVG